MMFGILADDNIVHAGQISLNKKTVSMAPATTVTLKLKGASGKIKWSSSNKKVATVSSSGKVTARAKGTAKIKATHKGKTYTCQVTVKYKTHTCSDGMRYKDVSGTFSRSGRWIKNSIGGGKYYFTNTEGSAIYFKVTGSKYVNVNFVARYSVATPYFAYSVDGGKMKRQLITNKKINVGNTKTHYIRVVIDSMDVTEDRWVGGTGVAVKSVKPVSKDGVVTAIKPQNATIAFFGDSITQGVRTVGWDLTPSGTSSTHGYAWYCAQQLDMVPYTVGFGSTGIFETGWFNNCYNATQYFSYGEKAPSFTADVIVVEHGTNDIYCYGDAFVQQYQKVLQKLHKQHPNAYIMAMIPLNQIHASEIRIAASSYSWCTVVETSSWNLSYTDGIHPNSAGAKKMGQNLAKKVAAKRKAVLK